MWKKIAVRTVSVAAAVSVIVGLVSATPAAASPTAMRLPSVDSLPGPFSGWDVQLRQAGDDPRVLDLSFNSPLLKQRIKNTVYLPTSYRTGGPRFPVMYALHGTVFSPLDNCALNSATSIDVFLRMIACGGGDVQDKLYNIPAQLDKMNFIVVSPDTDPTDSVCETCVWIDGRNDLLPNVRPATANTLPADSFLHKELYPLVETLFSTRTDRGGRGVMGFSMGAWAAELQGMMHPDQYSYIGYVSGGYDIFEPELTTVLNGLGYLRDQGYGTAVTDEIWWHQYNPKDIASNIRGTNIKFFLSRGDACLKLSSLTAPDCQGQYSPLRSATGSLVEQMLQRNTIIGVNDLPTKGIPFEAVELPGIHGSNNHRVFADYIVPQANATFASAVAQPQEFAYRAVLPRFSVWGYDVSVKRPNDEFLSLTGVRMDGRSMTITGSGMVDVMTPPVFRAGRTYTITATVDGQTSTRQVTADGDGRLREIVDLGKGTLIDARSLLDNLGIAKPRTVMIHVEG
jgi:enterochelin esterase-like enzyme